MRRGFHQVFGHLLGSSAREKVYSEERDRLEKKRGRALSREELEEEFADEFRDFVMTQMPPKGIGQRLLRFFENLLLKVQHWAGIRPSLNVLVQDD